MATAIDGVKSQAAAASSADAINQDASVVEDGIKDIGKDQFLKLLVAQLKNQDPLDPQDGEQFAVNLAQFTQVEQLIDINNKLGAQADTSGSTTSLASFLGHEVELNSEFVNVENGNGGQLKFTLPGDAQNVTIELTNVAGEVVDSLELGQTPKGQGSAQLENLAVQSGEYGFRVTATGVNGSTYDVNAKVSGIVSGFIPGPEQTLLVDGKEVPLEMVSEVSLVK